MHKFVQPRRLIRQHQTTGGRRGSRPFSGARRPRGRSSNRRPSHRHSFNVERKGQTEPPLPLLIEWLNSHLQMPTIAWGSVFLELPLTYASP
jgi:hypothetical protein